MNNEQWLRRASLHATRVSFMKQARLLLIVHCTLFIVHSNLAQSLIGTWVGMKQELDSGFVCPLPLCLQVRSDSTYTLSLLDNAAAMPRARWAMSGGQLRLDTATYRPPYVQLTDEALTIRGLVPMTFRRVKPAGTLADKAALEKSLTNRVWTLGQVRYHFHDGGHACLDHPNGDRSIHCWTTTERDGALFIVVKGNRVDCSRNYQAPMQVLGTSAGRVVVSQFGPDAITSATLVAGAALRPGTTCEAVGFQLCSSCFYEPYNQADGLHKKGPPGQFYAIRQRLQAEFKPIDIPDQTGLVQVRCFVNCEGQAGRFSAITYGPDYQRCQLDPRLVDQLLGILRTHFQTGWQPGKHRQIDRALDYVATINIRLVEGKIVDVFP